MSESPPSNDPLDEAFAAYLRSCDAGDVASREEFLEKFPDLADELKQLMDAADMIGRVTLSGGSDGISPTSNVSPGADTIASHLPSAGDSDGDPAATLPMANRAKGDPGPTLPFELGDYQLLEVIGRGGMGVVYKAKQNHLDRIVAVKMIRGGLLADEADVRRFYTEAQAAARLHHPGIVSVHQFGRRAGHHFFSMEHIRGTDLQRRIDEGTIDPKVAARYVRDVAQAIHHAHQKGVLHRDLKPANVLIDEENRLHVTDFGLAKHMDADSSVTHSGAAVGTPHYMAPEQAGGHSDRASRHSDVYSLGAILFACLAGRPPIVADTVVQTLLQVVHDPAPPLRSVCPEAPYDLETIVAKCLEKNPEKRYDSAEELAEELDAFLEGRPIRARPRSSAVKLWHWVEGVPLVAAVSGKRVVKPTVGHRRLQAAILLMLLLMPVFAAAIAVFIENRRHQVREDANQPATDRMPAMVRIAGGISGGVYNQVSEKLAERISAATAVNAKYVGTTGSIDNREQLKDRLVDLAPMQATAINSDYVCVVAPLFYELTYVLARADSDIQSAADLRDATVAVGTRGSGSRVTAAMIFETLELTGQVKIREIPSGELSSVSVDAAVICVGRGSKLVADLMKTGRWRLIPINENARVANAHPPLRTMTITPDEFDWLNLPPKGVATVGTTAYLAAAREAPSPLVIAALDALYESPPICEGLISRRRAAEFSGLDYHRAAREYIFHRDESD